VLPGVPQHWSGHGHEGWPAGAEHQERAGVERVWDRVGTQPPPGAGGCWETRHRWPNRRNFLTLQHRICKWGCSGSGTVVRVKLVMKLKYCKIILYLWSTSSLSVRGISRIMNLRLLLIFTTRSSCDLKTK